MWAGTVVGYGSHRRAVGRVSAISRQVRQHQHQRQNQQLVSLCLTGTDESIRPHASYSYTKWSRD